ncbi:sensor histidine kinase [Streptococcus sanguinis]|uniref:Sensor histidine kinase n=1 Tax=Streptococcus sanguinis SK408 TaxID=888818 RepID=F2CF69_STRSA|nr:sensor histidine kinase [Streptococcus sanguinis]EGC25982.1 histidine kinase [Streptococcus sanguinis SK678]EGF18127.1 sensor histidine kinase [Streptococcus sanguinis SK408]EGF22273.1 sensor histidine kinase [Streptococcus sanguinis SK1058]RSI29181.1 Sensor histidine kinase LiaS [Streptococcus sanguinis]
MKKSNYFLILLYTFFVLFIIFHYIFNIFDFTWQELFNDLELLQSFVFFVVIIGLSLTILIVIAARLIQYLSVAHVQKNLRHLLDGRRLEPTDQPELDSSLHQLERRLHRLTENLQKSENQTLQTEEKIIEKERRRIARDLHDTVSQELFAANMILSGVAGNVERLDGEKLQKQLKGIADILDTAQKDLRILLLHLRPTELENKTLVEGMDVIIKELTDKSDIDVHFNHQVGHLPKQMEEHVFRIMQEIINNTLRHAQASRLDIYLYQAPNELKIKVSDNGVGFDPLAQDELSYGLKNMEDRVRDMAGTFKLLTAPRKGLSIEITIPLLEGEDHEDIVSG